ncbi:MAG: exosortase/archaeosortase family protein [Flavobacteriales bacterium]|jgi:exosortase/archaeosortase family protein|nr:exosortase/archaeosortase family protein [Flavobacteriales bacterium]
MEFLKRNKEILLFLIKLGALCAFYFLWFSQVVWQLPIISTYYGHFVHYTMVTLTEGSVMVLNLLGYKAEVFNVRYIDLYDSIMNIYIKNFCLGIDMMFVFTALVLSFPGKWFNRLWFIPLGIIGIQLINIGRIVGMSLSWIILDRGDFVDHHDVFNLVATIFIFLMFTVWVNLKKKPAPSGAGLP